MYKNLNIVRECLVGGGGVVIFVAVIFLYLDTDVICPFNNGGLSLLRVDILVMILSNFRSVRIGPTRIP